MICAGTYAGISAVIVCAGGLCRQCVQEISAGVCDASVTGSFLWQVTEDTHNLRDKLLTLQDQNKAIRERNTILEDESTNLQSRVSKLQVENTKLLTENTNLQVDVTALQAENTALQGSNEIISQERVDLMEISKELRAEVTRLQNQIR